MAQHWTNDSNKNRNNIFQTQIIGRMTDNTKDGNILLTRTVLSAPVLSCCCHLQPSIHAWGVCAISMQCVCRRGQTSTHARVWRAIRETGVCACPSIPAKRPLEAARATQHDVCMMGLGRCVSVILWSRLCLWNLYRNLCLWTFNDAFLHVSVFGLSFRLTVNVCKALRSW